MYGIRVHFDHRARRIGYPASTCGPSSTGALAAPNDHSAAHCSARSRLKRAAEMLHVVGRCAASMRRAADTGSHRWSHLGGPFAETSCASAWLVFPSLGRRGVGLLTVAGAEPATPGGPGPIQAWPKAGEQQHDGLALGRPSSPKPIAEWVAKTNISPADRADLDVWAHYLGRGGSAGGPPAG